MWFYRPKLKMADVVITLRIMPESPETDLKAIEDKARPFITEYGGEVGKVEIQPIAFGLKALNLIFVSNEDIGSTDRLEQNISSIEGVNSVEVTDVRRAIG
ncbi:elongation factor 1-beta [Candidatus Woesearchaeota archaeon]|nr:elongation factor 1-beta [Candidatus Woesearchaeota archaeon]